MKKVYAAVGATGIVLDFSDVKIDGWKEGEVDELEPVKDVNENHNYRYDAGKIRAATDSEKEKESMPPKYQNIESRIADIEDVLSLEILGGASSE